jgi:hypothetical protein
MKHLILSFATTLLLLSCAEKTTETNTQIAGTIKGFSSGTVYLRKMNDTVLVTIDSVQMKGDSKFRFDFDLDSPEVVYLEINRGVTNSIDNNLPIFAEPGTITVDASLNHFFASAKITGSKNHDLYEQFQKINTKYNGELLAISKEKFDAIRFERLQDVDSIENKFNQKLKRKYLYAINFALANKDFEVAPFVALTELNNANLKYLDTINKTITPKVAQSKYGKLLTEYTKERKNEK